MALLARPKFRVTRSRGRLGVRSVVPRAGLAVLPLVALLVGATVGAAPATSATAGPRVIATFKVPLPVDAIAANSRTGQIYLGNQENGSIAVVSERSLHVTANLKGGDCCGVYNLAVNQANGNIFAAGIDDFTYIINGVTHKATNMGFGGGGVFYDAANNTAYLPDLYTYKVALIQRGAMHPTGYKHIGTEVNAEIAQIAIDPTSDTLYMVYLGAGAVPVTSGIFVLSGKTNHGIGFIPVKDPGQVAVDPISHRLYVTSGATASTVFVYDSKTLRAITQVSLGGDFIGPMVVNSATHTVFMLNYGNVNDPSGGEGLSILNGTTNKVVKTIPAPKPLTNGLAIDPSTGKVFMAMDGFVDVIK